MEEDRSPGSEHHKLGSVRKSSIEFDGGERGPVGYRGILAWLTAVKRKEDFEYVV